MIDRTSTHSNILDSSMSIRKVQAVASGLPTASPFRPGLRLDLSYRDPDEMSERSIHWGIEQSQLGSGQFNGGTRAIHSGQIQLSCSHRTPGLLIRGEVPHGAVALSSIVRQAAPVFFNGRRVADHQVIQADSQHEIDFRTIGANKVITVAVHAPLFNTLARATLGPEFFDHKPSDRFSLQGNERRPRLNQCLVALLDEGFTQSDRLSDAAYCRNWEYRVLSAWLADAIAPDHCGSSTLRHRAARHAEAFLRANVDRPISIAELCLETGAAKRTLMLGFQEAYGIAPLAYHRRLRLNGARRELSYSSRHDVTVSQVALRWGFDHFGRFSVDYHRLFGETPTATLR
jgi:AraC family transcriptional regulator, ethanolamine operon transcriptional activator